MFEESGRMEKKRKTATKKNTEPSVFCPARLCKTEMSSEPHDTETDGAAEKTKRKKDARTSVEFRQISLKCESGVM